MRNMQHVIMLQVFVHWLGRALLCTSVETWENSSPKKVSPINVSISGNSHQEKDVEIYDLTTMSDSTKCAMRHLENIRCQMRSIEGVLYNLTDALQRPQTAPTGSVKKWKVMAAVLDRVFIVTQVAMICLATGFLLPRGS